MPAPAPQGDPAPFLVVVPDDLDPWLSDHAALIVDIRPPAAFSSARVPRAISLSVPSTLLKRPLFSLERLAAMLSSPSAISCFSSWSSASRILVYDADSTTISDSSNIHGLLRKFNVGGFNGELAWVKGGFHAIWRTRRDIVDELPPTPEPEADEEDDTHDKTANPVLRPRHLPPGAFLLSSTTQHNSLHPSAALGTGISATKCPPSVIARSVSSPPTAISHPAFNPFFDTVRQNTELSQGITERIPLRLPRRVRRRIHELPFPWLRDIARRAANAVLPNKSISDTSSSESENDSDGASPANIEEGKEALAMQFFKIELSEQRRLMGIMEHHSKESGQLTDEAYNSVPFPFSITAGVEKGAKNRYRHIWPFEHARVRLHQKREADDDYINASYIQPLGTDRRYIATQGPLPATFTDFWTLCWEQNVQVIVMLTREVEGAMVKCGTYWSDSVFGPLRLRLVSTEGAITTDERPASAGFFGQHDALSAHSSRPIHPKFPHSAGSQRRYKHHHYLDKRSETVKRVFELTNTAYPDAKPRRIVHFQYLEWPDMNVPDDPRGVLGLVKRVEDAVAETRVYNHVGEQSTRKAGNTASVLEMDEKMGIAKHALGNSPVLLHCSAGVGRTGGFIAVDAILDAVRREVRNQRESASGKLSAQPTDAQSMDVDEKEPANSTTAAQFSFSQLNNGGVSRPPEPAAHMPVNPPTALHQTGDLSAHSPEAAFDFSSSNTSQWAQNVSQETGINGFGPPRASAFGFNIATTPSSIRSSQAYYSHSSTYHSSSSALGTSVSGASSSSKANFPASTHESRGLAQRFQSVLGGEQSSPDQRLRTTSAPSRIKRLIPSASSSPTKHPSLPLRLDFSSIPKNNIGLTLANPSFSLGNLPPILQAPYRKEGVSSEGELPSRSASPSADEATMKTRATILQPSGPPPLQPGILPAFSTSPPGESQTTAFDYKKPRPLHENRTPPMLSSFEDPVWEVVQDMREQRMSLCQSLRQYVFVHAAIIEGALMVVDEENEIADGLRPRQQSVLNRSSKEPPTMPAVPLGLQSASAESVATNSSSFSIGKRPSSPTELPKQNKKGEEMLSKRPSIKRKHTNGDDLDHIVEDMRYHPVPLLATSSMMHVGAPSSRSLPP